MAAGLVWSGLDCCGFYVLGEMATPSVEGGGGRRTVNMLEAKTHLSRLVEAIETGAATEVVIARNGRPVARLTALAGPERPRRLGVARGQFTVPKTIDAANPLIAELFEQA
jgi:antitoxin (DNA-binding transcriptional repressor) of toxin-antitoxin stability system